MNAETIAIIAANLMSGAHPDSIHAVHVPRFTEMAIKLYQEAVKQTDALKAPPEPPK